MMWEFNTLMFLLILILNIVSVIIVIIFLNCMGRVLKLNQKFLNKFENTVGFDVN